MNDSRNYIHMNVQASTALSSSNRLGTSFEKAVRSGNLNLRHVCVGHGCKQERTAGTTRECKVDVAMLLSSAAVQRANGYENTFS